MRLCELADGDDLYTVTNMRRLCRDLNIDPDSVDMDFIMVTGLPLGVLYTLCEELELLRAGVTT